LKKRKRCREFSNTELSKTEQGHAARYSVERSASEGYDRSNNEALSARHENSQPMSRAYVVPAQAGIQWSASDDWVPAYAGMTDKRE